MLQDYIDEDVNVSNVKKIKRKKRPTKILNNPITKVDKRDVRILSFDCGTKNLGVVGCIWNSQWCADICGEITKIDETNLDNVNASLDIINNILYHQWNLQFVDCKNLIGDKKLYETTAVQRGKSLKEYLNILDTKFPNPDIVIIEKQVQFCLENLESMHSLIYHYSDNAQIYIIEPSKKNNNLDFGAGSIEHYITKYAKNYTANKKHTEANLLKFFELTGNMDLIDGVKNIKDIADALFQMVMYCARIYSHNK